MANGTTVSRMHGRVAWNVPERIKHIRSSNVMQGRTHRNVGQSMQLCNDLSNTVQNVGKGCMEGKDLGEDPGYQGLAEQSLVTRIVPKPVGAW